METRTSHHKDLKHHSHHSSSSSPKNTVRVLADHQPVNRQEIERLDIGEITEAITVNTVKTKEHCEQTIISELEDQRAQITSPESNTVVVEVKKEHCAQIIISELEDQRAQITSPESNTVVVEAEIHAESSYAQHMVHFEEAHDFSDAGSSSRSPDA